MGETDLISRQAAIDATWKNPSYTDPINVLTEVRDRIQALPSAQPDSKELSSTHKALDTISRQAAIDALWKALFSYEEKEEERFQKSEELDVGDWFLHRIFVQNMNDIDRQAIRELPSAQPEHEYTMEEFMFGQDMGNPEDGSL